MAIKGEKLSEKTKTKISLSKKGKKLTEAHKIALHVPKSVSNWAKGKPKLDKRGENHPNWKGGTSKGYRKGYRDNLAYKEWRKSVFERDDYTCQDCNITGVYITAHHIKSFSKYPELRLEITNGKTLCEDCHKKTDNYKGRGAVGVKKIKRNL